MNIQRSVELALRRRWRQCRVTPRKIIRWIIHPMLHRTV